MEPLQMLNYESVWVYWVYWVIKSKIITLFEKPQISLSLTKFIFILNFVFSKNHRTKEPLIQDRKRQH
jgi:hypothetical protein